MEDYISRQAAIDSALNDDIVVMVANDDEDKDFAILEKTRKGIARNLEELPAADVQPVKRGRWVAFGNTGLASCECGFITDRHRVYSYCPKCGAHMKEDD